MTDTGDTTKILHKILDEITLIKLDVSSLKTDVSELKSDVSELKSDVSELKSDVSELKSDVSELKSDMGEVKNRLSSLEDTVYDIREDLRDESTATRALLAQAFEHISDQMASSDQSIQPSAIFRHSRSRTRTSA